MGHCIRATLKSIVHLVTMHCSCPRRTITQWRKWCTSPGRTVKLKMVVNSRDCLNFGDGLPSHSRSLTLLEGATASIISSLCIMALIMWFTWSFPTPMWPKKMYIYVHNIIKFFIFISSTIPGCAGTGFVHLCVLFYVLLPYSKEADSVATNRSNPSHQTWQLKPIGFRAILKLLNV